MPSSLGPAEILVILVVALIVLGPAKLPQAGRQVGRALAEIRKWTTEVKSEVKGAFDVETAMNAPPSYQDYPPYTTSPSPSPAVAEPGPPVDLSKPARPSTVSETVDVEKTADDRL